MLLAAKEENSKHSRFNPPLLFNSKGHKLKAHTTYIINSDPGQTRSKQQLEKYLKITFASPSQSTDGKEKEMKNKMPVTNMHAQYPS